MIAKSGAPLAHVGTALGLAIAILVFAILLEVRESNFTRAALSVLVSVSMVIAVGTSVPGGTAVELPLVAVGVALPALLTLRREMTTK